MMSLTARLVPVSRIANEGDISKILVSMRVTLVSAFDTSVSAPATNRPSGSITAIVKLIDNTPNLQKEGDADVSSV